MTSDSSSGPVLELSVVTTCDVQNVKRKRQPKKPSFKNVAMLAILKNLQIKNDSSVATSLPAMSVSSSLPTVPVSTSSTSGLTSVPSLLPAVSNSFGNY